MSDKGIIADTKRCSGCGQVKKISMSIYTSGGGEYHYCPDCQTTGNTRIPVSALEDSELKITERY